MNEIELIKSYLKNELKGDALKNFEQRLQDEEALREKVEDYKEIFLGFESLKAEALKEKVQSWSKDLPKISEAKKVELPKGSSFSILKKLTAAIFIIAIGSLVWWNMQGNQIPDDFAQTYYFGYSDGTEKSGSDSKTQHSEISYENARSQFIDKNFSACISILNNIQKTDSLYLLALYLKQYAYFENENFPESLATYEQLLQLKNNPAYKKEALNFIDAEWTSILAFFNVYKKDKGKVNKAEFLNRLKVFLAKSPSLKYREPAEKLRAWLE